MSQSENNTFGQIGLPCDRRYRNSKYFLEDQLRYSEAVADFRSIKEFLSNSAAFTGACAFQWQTAPVRSD
ncbi:MAG TPA: hypothetical protein V6C99_07480 [Oculatellaceae cyanobacterium]|jgi:hypothetical protein